MALYACPGRTPPETPVFIAPSGVFRLHPASSGFLHLLVSLNKRVGKDVFGGIENPGEAVIRKLVREGLVFVTEEEPILIHGEPFEFTPSLVLTEEGEAVFQSLKIRS